MKTEDKAERLLALILLEQMKGATQKEKATKLSVAGFSNLEIANLLQITAARVADALYEARQTGSAKKKTTKKAASKPSGTH
jgi:predicted transcriptional regulator